MGALLLLAAMAALAAPRDVGQALAALDSGRADERNAAERWLAQNLTPRDLPLVAASAAGGSLEVRRRLEAALGADARHLALGALLLAEAEPQVSAVGEAGLKRLVAAWSGSASQSPIPGDMALRALGGRGHERWSLQPDAAGLPQGIERLVQRAGRHLPAGAAPLGVVLDPALESGAPGRPHGSAPAPRAEGAFSELLSAVVAAHGARLEGFGLDGPHPWVRVAAPADVGLANGEELLLRWTRAVLEAGGRPSGAAAARALASSGWPAAVRWLEGRWREQGDANALEGLLAAAARGAVAPSLARGDRVRTLLAYADKRLAEGDLQALREVRGLHGALGALRPVGTDGSDLAAAVFEGYQGASPAGRALRLSILAEMGRMSDGARARLREELTGPAPGLDVLRALAATQLAPSAALAIPRPRGLLERAAGAGILELAVTWLLAIRAQPPPEWRTPGSLPAEWGPELRTAVFLWWQGCEGGEPAAAHLRALAASLWEQDEAPAGRTLAEVARSGGAAGLRASFHLARQRAGEGSEQHVLQRLQAHAGLLDAADSARLLDLLGKSAPLGTAACWALAALARGPSGDEARAVLLAEVVGDLERGAAAEPVWAEPMADVLRELERGERVLELRTLRRDLRSALQRSGHPLLLRRLDRPGPPQVSRALPVEAFEPLLEAR